MGRVHTSIVIINNPAAACFDLLIDKHLLVHLSILLPAYLLLALVCLLAVWTYLMRMASTPIDPK